MLHPVSSSPAIDIPPSDIPLVPPVALIRGSSSHSTHNALPLLLQALYAVPQIRNCLRQSGRWDFSTLDYDADSLHEGPRGLLRDGRLWGLSTLQSLYSTQLSTWFVVSISLNAILDFRELQHLFCALDYTQQAYLDVSNFLQIFGVEESSRLKPPDTQSLGRNPKITRSSSQSE